GSFSPCFSAFQIQVKLVAGSIFVIINFFHDDLFLILTEDLHIHAEALQFLNQYLERFWNARFRDVLALDDGFVSFDASYDVIRLNGKNLLQGVRCTISFERPNLHLTEALPAELGFTAK